MAIPADGGAGTAGAASSAGAGAGLGAAAGYGGAISATAGAIATIIGTIQAAKAAQSAAKYNAKVAENNAKRDQLAAEVEAQQQERLALLAEEDIRISQQSQAFRERRQREQQARVLGLSRAVVGASGLQLTGSPLATYENTVRQTEYDILVGRYEARLRERAFGEEATQRRYGAEIKRYEGREGLRVGRVQAGLLRSAGNQAAAAGYIQAAGLLASSAGQIAETYQREKTLLENR